MKLAASGAVVPNRYDASAFLQTRVEWNEYPALEIELDPVFGLNFGHVLRTRRTKCITYGAAMYCTQ